MNILLDHCVDRKLAGSLTGHAVKTTRQMRWEKLQNGELLAAAGQQFDVLLTVDQGIGHQQNPATLPIAVVILETYTNRLSDLVPMVPALLKTLETLAPRAVTKISAKGG